MENCINLNGRFSVNDCGLNDFYQNLCLLKPSSIHHNEFLTFFSHAFVFLNLILCLNNQIIHEYTVLYIMKSVIDMILSIYLMKNFRLITLIRMKNAIYCFVENIHVSLF